MSNPCARCGKERIIVKSWTETITSPYGDSTLTHTEYSCPDPDCQTKLTNKLNALHQENMDRAKAAQERADARILSLSQSRKTPAISE